MSNNTPTNKRTWVLPIIVAVIGLIGAFGAPFISCYLDDECNNPSEATQSLPPSTPSPTLSPILPPPADVYLPDHSEIKWDLVFIQGGTNTNAEIAQGMANVGFGDYDDVLRLLEGEFGRTTSYAYYYETPDTCEAEADLNSLLTQVILLKSDEGALGYLEWIQTHPQKVETYPLLDVGEKGYISWLHSSGACEMVDLYLEYQKYNALINIQIGFNGDQISRADIKAMGIHLAEVIELKLDAAVQK